ncbi:MAG: RNA-binding protein [Candidatus Scalindua rubra]|uniref:RNA-binding protein n=1 Tax=Candidatus Scalindua rubra TaxID=1872076 RepID=A0A1E3XFC8_9BACT|nr:MAG: RNA-binding protein [Candidatus Scalindua rubra]
MKIYVGNLSFNVTEEELKKLFSEHGNVSSVDIIKDKFTGKSRGFGFVEMADQSEAESAIQALNGKKVKDRNIKVNQARPRSNRPKARSSF